MGVLFLMPTYSAPSELWMQRMIEGLEPHITAIGAYAPTESLWRGRIPVLSLKDAPPPVWRRVARRLRLPVEKRSRMTVSQTLLNIVEADDIDLILVHYLEFALQFKNVWAQTRKPLFVHCHGYDVTWDWRHHDNPVVPYFGPDYLPAVRALSQRATIIANSKHTAEGLAAADIDPERMVIKHYGVPIPSEPQQRSARTTGIEILYLGRLVDFKGPDLVIRAFERACERGLDAHLTLAGDGELRTMCELLQRRSRFAERITLLGAVDASTGDRLRSAADIFTAHNCRGPLSHQEEAFGVSIVEAMAAALPVVSGRSGSLPEVLKENETGLLVEPGDVEAHAEALLQLSQNVHLRHRMGEAGWRRAKEFFSSELERERLLQIMDLH